MTTHYTYNSAPSKLNKKELYQEYIKLVEHSKKNDFLYSCGTPTRTQKQHIEAQNDMIEKQKKYIQLYEEKDEISASVIKDYEEQNAQLKMGEKLLQGIKKAMNEELKKAKKENKELKEEIEYIEEQRQYDHTDDDYEDLKLENEKLQEELNKYKECANKIREELSSTDEDEEDTVEYFCKGCDRIDTTTETEYKCSEGLCEECQKYL